LLPLINTTTYWLQMLTWHTQIRTIIKAALLPQTPRVCRKNLSCRQQTMKTLKFHC
jgi:hypothetical protein